MLHPCDLFEVFAGAQVTELKACHQEPSANSAPGCSPISSKHFFALLETIRLSSSFCITPTFSTPFCLDVKGMRVSLTSSASPFTICYNQRMSKEFESCGIVEARMNVLIIPKQDVEFSNPIEPKTEEAEAKEYDRMFAFIHEKGFQMVMNNPEQRCLLVDDGLGIGMFSSLEEIYHYVKNGYPAADIEKWKSFLADEGYPADFHKLPFELQRKWEDMPEEAKQAIRERGAGIVEVVKIEESEDGKRVIHPNPKFQPEPDDVERSEEEQRKYVEKHVKYIYKSGFKVAKTDGGQAGIAIDANTVIGPFLSLEDAVRYLKEEHHLFDIASIKEVDDPTVH